MYQNTYIYLYYISGKYSALKYEIKTTRLLFKKYKNLKKYQEKKYLYIHVDKCFFND